VPNDLTLEAQHVFIDVTDANGIIRNMPSFVIRTDQASIIALEPGASVTERARVFWSSNGFAFEKPGHFVVEVRVLWSIAGIPVGVKSAQHVWVNFPQTQLDNDAAAELLHPEVGKYVALGGDANHLPEAVVRLSRVMGVSEETDDRAAPRAAGRTATERPKALRGFKDLVLPGQRVERSRGPVRAPEDVPVSVASAVEKRGSGGRAAAAHASGGGGNSGKSTRNRTR